MSRGYTGKPITSPKKGREIQAPKAFQLDKAPQQKKAQDKAPAIERSRSTINLAEARRTLSRWQKPHRKF